MKENAMDTNHDHRRSTGAPAVPPGGLSRRTLLRGMAGGGGVLALGLAGAGCGTGSSGNGSATVAAPKQLGARPARLTMLYAGNQSDAAAVAAVLPMLHDAIGITLEVDNLPYDALQQKTFSELAGGKPAHDIYVVDTPWTPTLTRVLEPLGSYLTSAALNKGIDVNVADFIPKVFHDTSVYKIGNPSLAYPDPTATVDVGAITRSGFAITGLPIQGNALVMAYRKDLFDSPAEQQAFRRRFGRPLAVPVTWDDFTQVAQHFTRPSQRLYGTTLMAGVGDWAIDDFKTMVGSFGGDGHLINGSFGIEITTPEATAALQYYADLINRYKVTPPGTTAASWDNATSSFAAGLTAMTMNYTPQALNSGVRGQIGYAMVPKKVAYAPHFGTWQLSVPAAAGDNTKAWAYRTIAWLTSSAAQVAMLGQELHPSRQSAYAKAASDASIQAKSANFYPVLEQSLSNGVGRARVKQYGQVTQPIAVGVNNAATGSASPATAMSKAASQVKSTLDSFGYHATIA
jgi:multiple sugar transport system substrate-binding protein